MYVWGDQGFDEDCEFEQDCYFEVFYFYFLIVVGEGYFFVS